MDRIVFDDMRVPALSRNTETRISDMRTSTVRMGAGIQTGAAIKQ